MDDVDRVVGTQRLRQDVADAGALQDGTHRTTGDNTGTGRSRLQEHDAARVLSDDLVRDRLLDHRDAEEVALRLLDTLLDRGRDLTGLAVTNPDLTGCVTDDDGSGEREPPSTLDHLGDAVDRDDPLLVLRTVVIAASSGTSSSCHQSHTSLWIIN